jgi:hypothetical protein
MNIKNKLVFFVTGLFTLIGGVGTYLITNLYNYNKMEDSDRISPTVTTSCAVGVSLIISYVGIMKLLGTLAASLKADTELCRLRRELERRTHKPHDISAMMDPRGLSYQIKTLLQSLADDRYAQLPKDFFCQITLHVMCDPVQTTDGFSYERTALQEWYDSGHTYCPIDRTKSLEDPHKLPTNITFQSFIYTTLKAIVENKTRAVSEVRCPAGTADRNGHLVL